MSVQDVITSKLTEKFSPVHLEVIDESHKHKGHSGYREGIQTHFRVRIATTQFAGQTRLAQHRQVMEVLKEELDADVHALAIEVLAVDGPFETVRRVE